MKKVISVILALALCISLVPAAFATDTGYEWARNPKMYVYEFNNSAHNHSEQKDTYSFHLGEHKYSNLKDETAGKWGFVTLQNGYGFGTSADHLYWTIRLLTGDPIYAPGTSMTGTNSSFVLEVEVENAGKYTPYLTYIEDKSSPIVDIYLFEAPADRTAWDCTYTGSGLSSADNYFEEIKNLDSSKRIGNAINLNGSGNTKKVSLTPVELKAGRYFLVLLPVKPVENWTTGTAGNYKTCTMKFKNFALSEELTEAKAKTLEYIFDADVMNTDMIPKSTYSKGDSTSIRYKTDGTVVALYNLRLANWENMASVTHKGEVIPDDTKNPIPASGNGLTYEECEPYYTLDLTKTAPYAIDSVNNTNGGLINGGNSNLNSGGFLQGLFDCNLYNSRHADYKSNPADRGHIAIRLNIPYSGRYKIAITNDYPANATWDALNAATKVYFGAAPSAYSANAINAIPSSLEYDALGWYYLHGMYTGDALATSTEVEYFEIDVPVAGEYYLAFLTFPESYTDWNSEGSVSGTKLNQMINLSSITLTPLPGEVGAEEAAIEAARDTMTADIAEESTHNLSNSATVNVLTTTVNSTEDTSIHTATPYTTTRGAELTVTAPKYDDYTFLYWTKGIGKDRRVVSDSESYTLTAPAGGTYLTAVYKEKNDNKTSVVFFDASGNELSRALYNQGDNITFPSAPSLTDYNFEGWALAGTEGTVESAEATGNQMIFVAQFSEEPTSESVEVTVNNGTPTNYAYGSLVEVSATERKDGNGSDVFLYWTKDDEIVSFDKNYSFLAAESCELEAVYGAYKPSLSASLRRIIISGSFAEFIGLEGAEEKGVLFRENSDEVSLETATHKIAIKNGGNQLKFENDLGSGASVIGYAILDDNTVIYSE